MVPMTECILPGGIENMNAYVEERLDRVPIPPHLLLLGHSFGSDLVDRRFGESG